MITAENISYHIKSKQILRDVSLAMRAGEILAVVGQNGAGKSSLLKILCGDLKPSSGAVKMENVGLSEWKSADSAKIRAVLPQDSGLNFPFTVSEVVLMGRAPHLGKTESARDYEIAEAALAKFEVADLRDRIYPTLSGGERQRVHLARVAAQIWEPSAENQPRFLFLDEPISSLDLAHQHQTLKAITRFAREGVGVFLILHDLNLTAQYADRILVLQNGEVLAIGTPAEIFTAPILKQAFGVEAVVSKHPFFDCPLIILSR
ncbi:MAG: heme ABC transporter ATP-binding protein [Acidobacteriota bacterium]|nr:heme ABC transporter ATP-binding protein [Acidobacteriota bacterium]